MSEVSTTPVVVETSSPVQALVESKAPAAEITEKPKVEAPKEKDFLAPKFAALSRKEKEIRALEQNVKAMKAEAEALKSDYETKSKSSVDTEAQMLKSFKDNPLKKLKEFGYTIEQLIQMEMNEDNPTTEMQMRRMREEIESKYTSELDNLKKSMKDKEEKEANQQWEAAVSNYKGELGSFIQNNSEAYELVATRPNGVDLMFETAEIYYKKTGRVPSTEELAKAVEEHFETEAKDILKLKKFQTATQAKTEVKTSQTAPTLSNTLSAEVPKSGTKLMTDEESKRAVAKMIRWED